MIKKIISFLVLGFITYSNSNAQPIDPRLFNSMQWRMIGPHRGGRTVGATGVAGQPNVFYIGV
ncbi:MAG TPA: hypothetical protein VLJ68_12460, partial [Chitinophagaceae bacterium]|nr:hypothetical protein [Chitinophagaceae bacterium]